MLIGTVTGTLTGAVVTLMVSWETVTGILTGAVVLVSWEIATGTLTGAVTLMVSWEIGTGTLTGVVSWETVIVDAMSTDCQIILSFLRTFGNFFSLQLANKVKTQ